MVSVKKSDCTKMKKEKASKVTLQKKSISKTRIKKTADKQKESIGIPTQKQLNVSVNLIFFCLNTCTVALFTMPCAHAYIGVSVNLIFLHLMLKQEHQIQ
jgi:hypothetical protein